MPPHRPIPPPAAAPRSPRSPGAAAATQGELGASGRRRPPFPERGSGAATAPRWAGREIPLCPAAPLAVPAARAALPQRARAFVLQSIPAPGGGSASTTAGAGGERGGALCGRKGHLGSSSRACPPAVDHYLAARGGSPAALSRPFLGRAGITAAFPRPSTASNLAEGRRHRQRPPTRLPSIVEHRPAPLPYLQCGAGASIPEGPWRWRGTRRWAAHGSGGGGIPGAVCWKNEYRTHAPQANNNNKTLGWK